MGVDLLGAVLLAGAAGGRGFSYPGLVCFAGWEEIVRGELSEDLCRTRRRDHEEWSRFEFPARLSHRSFEPGGPALGVSAGIAEGVLVRRESLSEREPSRPWILLTPTLGADLAAEFGRVRGIVAERGGLLSHLAILARERGLPVVVDPAAGRRFSPGDRVRLDGAAGTVERAG